MNLNFTPYNFGSEAAFKQQVDLAIAGMMQDCAECHVGGGAMEYVPAPTANANDRVSLRDIYATPLSYTKDSGGNTVPFGPFDSNMFTAFNKFIDTFDVDGDGDKLEVLDADWPNTGVIEMDCFLCHLQGYKYQDRVAAQRAAKFDVSRVVGSGVGTANTLAWDPNSTVPPEGYGTDVTYNNYVQDNGSGNLKFHYAINYYLKEFPPSDNCAFCHFGKPAVDWKKRGDNWANATQTYEVHKAVGCIGCHQAKVGTVIGTDNVADGNLGQCDPAKGIAPYSSAWNNTDGTVKTCEDCHLNYGYDEDLGTYSPAYGAPNPTGAHQAAGLTAVLCQTGENGVANASHLDIIDCAACHVRKIADPATNPWNTGGAIVDATGADIEGRMADHENEYVHREMYDPDDDATNITFSWLQGKIIATSVLNTVYWRDKNDVNHDVNADGRGGGMDTPLTTHVLAVNEVNGWTNLAEDNHGHITSTEIGARITALENGLPALTGKPGTPVIKISTMAVPFKVNHNIAPKQYAIGKQCTDCHGNTADLDSDGDGISNGGIFNGAYTMQGVNMDMTNLATQVTPLTKANSFEDVTDFHPNTKNKLATRTIPIKNWSGLTTMRAVDRSETLWENTFRARNTTWHANGDPIVGGAIPFPAPGSTGANTKGLWLKVEVDTNLDGVTDVTRTRMVNSFVDSTAGMSGLLNDLGSGATDGTDFTDDFEFVISDNGAGGLQIEAKAGNQIRLNPATTSGATGLNLVGYVWTPTPIIGVDGNPYPGRTEWVAYLNSINPNDVGIGLDPIADIATIDGQDPDLVLPYIEIIKGSTVTLVADDPAAAGVFRYTWTFSDSTAVGEAQSVQYTFNTTGLVTVFLTVIDEENKLSQQSVKVNVIVPPPVTGLTYDATAGDPNVTLHLVGLPTHDRLYFYYGDGLRQQIYDSADSFDLVHTYRFKSKYLTGGNYSYNTSVRIYNGSTLVETLQENVLIPQ
ncbi:MAG: hypothetical protein JXO50_05300 [Deltaproteobacteria bacterium]|nr:hypothetical protein [Candidatus Anaeroferrophillus wilburensis]